MRWFVLSQDSQVLAVHAALLHNGQILYFSGDEHDKGQHDRGQIDHTRLFDCETLGISPMTSPGSDVFCCGHAQLVDGRLVVAGGTEAFPEEVPGPHHPHFPGLRDVWIFDPDARSWVRAADMSPEPGLTTGGGRWYPTLVTLADGRVLAASGHPRSDDTRHQNDSPEAFSPSPRPSGTWRLLTGADPAHETSTYYPRLHVLPGGDVLFVTPTGGRTVRFNPATGGYSDVCASPPDGLYATIQSSSVLLPLRPQSGYRTRVLVTGAAQPYILDLGTQPPGWQPTQPRALAGAPLRQNGCAVMLPTGQVLCVGGVVDPANDTTAVRTAELYDPDTGAWSVLAEATVPRNYHSVALLMPDGRIWTAGSNKGAQQSFPAPGVDNRELRIELFEPPYYNERRPELNAGPQSVGWGRRFDLGTPDSAQITRVTLVRAGSVTHAYDSDQRHVELVSQPNGPQAITAWAPPEPDLAPPGYYLAFLLNASRVPSAGRFVRLAPAASSTGFLVQSNFGQRGNFEVVAPYPQGGLQHWWRDNDAPGLPWHGPIRFGQTVGAVSGPVALIQSTFDTPGNLEVVARVGDRLLHFWRESAGAMTWHGPFPFANGVTGNPALIQGVFGGRGNFELVVPLGTGGLAHYWRNNDEPGLPWNGPFPFGTDAGTVDSVTMIQSNFGSPGNLEVAARIGDALHFFWRDSAPPWTWHHGGIVTRGVRGNPALIQSRHGQRGNFELVIPRDRGGLVHLWRNNDAPGLPWSGHTPFGDGDPYDEATLIQSNFGSPLLGNLDVTARTGGNTRSFWRTDRPPWAWSPAPASAL